MHKVRLKDVALDGLVRQNPIYRLVLGTCPTLAVSTAVMNGLGMGLVVAFVLICSNFVISCVRNLIPDKIRIPAYMLIIATLSTIVEMGVMKLSLELYDSLGVYLPLVAVNCLVLARVEAFASSNKPHHAVLDGFFMGIGYTLALTIICALREILGNGSFLGYQLWSFKIGIFVSPAGAFLSFGIVLITFNAIYNAVVRKNKHQVKPQESHA